MTRKSVKRFSFSLCLFGWTELGLCALLESGLAWMPGFCHIYQGQSLQAMWPWQEGLKLIRRCIALITPHRWDQCEKSFQTPQQLKLDRRLDSGEGERPYSCCQREKYTASVSFKQLKSVMTETDLITVTSERKLAKHSPEKSLMRDFTLERDCAAVVSVTELSQEASQTLVSSLCSGLQPNGAPPSLSSSHLLPTHKSHPPFNC